LRNLRSDAERSKEEREKEKNVFKDKISKLENDIIEYNMSMTKNIRAALESKVEEQKVIESERDDLKEKLDDLMSECEELKKV